MIKNAKDKMVSAAPDKAAAGPEQDYFFSGSTEYVPQTVRARNIDEATEIWQKTRTKVEHK